MWGKPSNAVYVQSMQLVRERTAHPKVAHVWAELIPNVFHRVFLRRMQMGCIPNLKVNTSKWGSSSDPATVRREVECTCAHGGVQDAHHFFFNCAHTEHLRQACLLAAKRAVDSFGNDASRVSWEQRTDKEKLQWGLSPAVKGPWRMEAAMKQAFAQIWVVGATNVCDGLAF